MAFCEIIKLNPHHLFPEMLGHSVGLSHIGNHPRSQEEDRFRAVVGVGLISEKSPQDGDLTEDGDPRFVLLPPVLDQSADDDGLGPQ